jgi:glycosyltransferase involved in cell wall biosynthesis
VQLSIVMPTYNGMKYLEQAIDSVLSQSHRDWELIISDDGSTDHTRDYLAGLKDPRIKIHFQPTNLGIFGNLNFVLAQAGNAISQILCQDDYLLDPGSLDRLLSEWSRLPSEVVYLRCNHLLDATSNHALYEDRVLPPIVNPEQSDLFFYIFGCIPGNLSNVSVRTQAVAPAGWFRTDLPYAGDFEFWSRLGRMHPWAISKTKVAHVRSHSGQASRNFNRHGELLPQMREVLDPLYANLVRKGYSPTLLRLEATLNYTSRFRYNSIRGAINGGGTLYLRKITKEFDSSRFSFGPSLGWFTFFASLGGRLFTNSVARLLLNQQPHPATDRS